MTTGHFGLATGVKAGAPRVPLWALMTATYLLDFVFIGLVSAGLESFAPIDPAHPAYGQVVIHASYSHSLVGALVIAGVAAIVSWPVWGKRGALLIGAVTLSHWFLDLIVHRPDLPILPGNAGHLPLLGFGLWTHPAASAALELLIVAVGVWLYYGLARRATRVGSAARPHNRSRAMLGVSVTAVLLVLLALSDFFSLPMGIGGLIMLALIVLCGWLDARVDWSEASRTPELAAAD
jgi:hypothetical protein